MTPAGLCWLEWIRRDTRAQDAIALTKDSIYKRAHKADDQLIDEYLAEGLFIKLDGFLRSIASQAGYTHITTYMYKVPEGIIKAYHRALTTVSNLSGGTTVSSAFNTTTREVEKRAMVMSVNAPFPLDVEHVAMPEVTGKDDSRIFLADIIANYLHHHLSHLPYDAPLNAPNSIDGWLLQERV